MKTTTTYTYAFLPVSEQTYNEIRKKLLAAGYYDAFCDDKIIDMHGLALKLEKTSDNSEDSPFQ